MRSSSRNPVVLALFVLAACVPPSSPSDPHSFARPAQARVTHVSLDLTPDFATHRMTSTARLAIQRSASADSIILDTRDLTISRITDARGTALGYTLGAPQKILGSPLAIALRPGTDTIVIDYQTSPSAAAVQWLSPAQTAGKRLPFLFTQGEAILTRTWIPTQDSPGIRQSYDATIHVPADMRAVMSAEHIGPEGQRDARGLAVYRFRMAHPIPPYLIALAIGDLEFRRIGARTGVYAERDPARVNLLTLHSTKGLEFSRVYIVGAEDAQLPGGRDPSKREIEEARRLLYVGMTRTKDRLVLTRVEARGGKPTGRHRFLDEMGLVPVKPSPANLPL